MRLTIAYATLFNVFCTSAATSFVNPLKLHDERAKALRHKVLEKLKSFLLGPFEVIIGELSVSIASTKSTIAFIKFAECHENTYPEFDKLEKEEKEIVINYFETRHKGIV